MPDTGTYWFLVDMGDGRHVYFHNDEYAHYLHADLIIDMRTGKVLKDRYGDPHAHSWPPLTCAKWKRQT